MRVAKKDKSDSTYVYAWGDDSSLQLGSCDHHSRATPSEVRWVTKFLVKNLDNAVPGRIAVGGGHNLLLTEGLGRIHSLDYIFFVT